MPRYHFAGLAGVNRADGFTDSFVRSLVTGPTARISSNGNRPFLVLSMAWYASSRGSVRNITGYVADAAGAGQVNTSPIAHAVGSDASIIRGDFGLTGSGRGFAGSPVNVMVGLIPTGDFYFGRNVGTGGTTVDAYDTYPNSSLSGYFNYVEVPTEPRTPGAVGGSGSVALSWVAPLDNGGAGILGYIVQRATNSTFTAGVVEFQTGNVTSYTDTTAAAGSTYFYRVSAFNVLASALSGRPWSPWSASVTASSASAPSAPAAPSLAVGHGLVEADWLAPADGGSPITGYELQTANNSSFTGAAVVASLTLRATAIDLVPGSAVYARVRASNAAGVGAWSAASNATIPARGTLDGVESASVTFGGRATTLFVNSTAASPAALTLMSRSIGDPGSSLVGAIETGTSSTTFWHGSGLDNLAITHDPNGNAYLVGRRGDSPTTLLVQLWAKTPGVDAWTPGAKFSIAAPSGDPLTGFAVGYAADGATPSLLIAARRAGRGGANSLVGAVVKLSDPWTATASNSPAWLPAALAALAGSANLAPLAITPLQRGGSTFAIAADAVAVVAVSNGVPTLVGRSASGAPFITGSKVSVFGLSAATFGVASVRAGDIRFEAFNTSAGSLGFATVPAARSFGGAFGRAWAGVFNPVTRGARFIYTPAAGASRLSSTIVSVDTLAVAAEAVVVNPFGPAAGVNSAVRAPAGYQDERFAIIEGANLNGAAKSTALYASTLDNATPNAPALATRSQFDATLAAAFSWAFSDPNALDVQSAYQLLIQRVSDSVAVVDTGKVNGAASSYTVAANALVNGTTYRWAVRTYDAVGAVSPYAAWQQITPSSAGTLTITSPAADNPVGLESSSVPIAWTYVQGESYTQIARRVRLLRTSTGTVISDTGMVSTTVMSHTVTNIPTDVPVTIELSIRSNAPSAPDPVATAIRRLTSSYGQPMTPNVDLTVGENFVHVDISNPPPTGSRPEVTSNTVERRTPGGVWVALAVVGSNGFFDDREVAAGLVYEYRVLAVGGLGEVYSDTGSISAPAFEGAWLHDPRDPAGTEVHARYTTGRATSTGVGSEGFQLVGRRLPVREFSEFETKSLSCEFAAPYGPDYAELVAWWRWAATAPVVVCYRDNRGRKIYAAIGDDGVTETDVAEGTRFAVTLEETDYKEGL